MGLVREVGEDALQLRGGQGERLHEQRAAGIGAAVDLAHRRPQDQVAAVHVEQDDVAEPLADQVQGQLLDHGQQGARREGDRAAEPGVRLRVAERQHRQQEGIEPLGHSARHRLRLQRIGGQRQVAAMLLSGADRQDRQLGAARRQLGGCVASVQDTATLPAGRASLHLYAG